MVVSDAIIGLRGIEMTKKDYKLIADVLRETAWAFDDDRYAFLEEIVEGFCDMFVKDNSNFKKHKFEVAVFGKR